ncbi:MAG: serine/threonine-protein kinase, partial [Myxococcota bacterium]|nr:serine/threonine-protein kinase [Myxococcota bacterium]
MGLRLRDEARILGLLKHRAVVGVDSLVRLDHGWAVVMEYVAGVDTSVIIKNGAPPVTISLEIMEEVASALYAAYFVASEGTGEPLKLVHRDIKPANIRITPRGEVKILDFGVATADFQSREANTRSTLFGSFTYMAPERLDGIDGPEVDIYSLGLVAVRLITGRPFKEPPKHYERHEGYVKRLLDALDEALDKRPDIDATQRLDLHNLIDQMIAFEGCDRPTARDVERTCRKLRTSIEGPWLREWAETSIPSLAEQSGGHETGDPFSGSILLELGEEDLPTEVEGEDETSQESVPTAVVTGSFQHPDFTSPTESITTTFIAPQLNDRSTPWVLIATIMAFGAAIFAVVFLGLGAWLLKGGALDFLFPEPRQATQQHEALPPPPP